MAKDSNITYEDIEMYLEIYDAYCNRHVSGGSLHIAIEDGNCSKSDFEYCKTYAMERNDYIGVALADFLAKMPDDVMRMAADVDIPNALILWQGRIP